MKFSRRTELTTRPFALNSQSKREKVLFTFCLKYLLLLLIFLGGTSLSISPSVLQGSSLGSKGQCPHNSPRHLNSGVQEMVLPAAGRYRTSILGKTIWLPPLVSLLVWRLFCEGCNNITFSAPHKLKAGVFIGRVNINKCSNHSGIISSSNPNFTVLEDGSLYTTNAIFLSSHGNTITLSFKDIHEKETKKIHVNLLTNTKKAQSVMARRVRETVLSRSKRRWAPVPTIIMENSLGPFPMQIQQLSSDMALKYSIRYSISGPGVDKPPLNYFYIEADTGNLFVTRPIDREQYPEFQLLCYAMTSDGYTPEIPLVHTIKIEDDNDNAPVFEHDIYTFYILEHSKLGTIVGQVTATDKDEPNTLHTKLKYKIVNRNLQIYQNSHIFVINPDTGCITVASSHLDRETAAEYKLEIEARDMGGQDFGLCSTAIVLIEVGDVNDNAPQLGQTTYEVSVAENTENLEVLCIPVIDDDEPGTPSWLATFTIIKGNEDNSFYITVDQNTNVGCLILSKELDYENTKERRLEIVVNNEATYVFPPNTRAVSTSLITVVIRVRDQDEGPVFEPCEYILIVKECLPSGTVVGNYQARDPETGNSRGLSYRIIKDECNWITIDDTGDLRTTSILDRDVLDMEGSQCNITVSATDHSGKTGTGKIVIKLMDENDNYPIVTRKDYIMCKDRKPICITAFDSDLPPNTAPFDFEIETPVGSTWTLTPKKDESALLSLMEDIDYGSYPMTLRIYDNGGNNGISEITIHYCDCVIPSECSELSEEAAVGRGPLETPVDRSPFEVLTRSAFVPWGALGLGSLVMMAGMGVPFGLWLRKRNSMTREAYDNSASANLSPSNTEAPGEELMDPNVPPVETMKPSMSMSTMKASMMSMNTVGEKNVKGRSLEMLKGGRVELVKGAGSHATGSLRDLGQHLRNSCKDICYEWQHFTNPHLDEKVFLCGQDDERKQDEEYLLSYKYEGKGSPVGSLSSCTGESEEEELDFLNQPEPPFRILVETLVKEKQCAYIVPENCNSLGRLPGQPPLE